MRIPRITSEYMLSIMKKSKQLDERVASSVDREVSGKAARLKEMRKTWSEPAIFTENIGGCC